MVVVVRWRHHANRLFSGGWCGGEVWSWVNTLDLAGLRAQIHTLHCVFFFLQKLLPPKVLGTLHSDVLMGGAVTPATAEYAWWTNKAISCYRSGDQSKLQFSYKHLEEPGKKYQRLIQDWHSILCGKSDNTSRLNCMDKFHMRVALSCCNSTIITSAASMRP